MRLPLKQRNVTVQFVGQLVTMDNYWLAYPELFYFKLAEGTYGWKGE
jgi:hypothetical protein